MFNVWKPDVTPLRLPAKKPVPETPRDVRERWAVLENAGAADSADAFETILTAAMQQTAAPAILAVSGTLPDHTAGLNATVDSVAQATGTTFAGATVSGMLTTGIANVTGRLSSDTGTAIAATAATAAAPNAQSKSQAAQAVAAATALMSDSERLPLNNFASIFQQAGTTADHIQDGQALAFECEMEGDDYNQYRQCVVEVYRAPKVPRSPALTATIFIHNHTYTPAIPSPVPRARTEQPQPQPQPPEHRRKLVVGEVPTIYATGAGGPGRAGPCARVHGPQ
jgi:hypothetical protein